MGWSKTDLKSVHNNICISAYCNAFKNVILNLIRFELNHAFNVDSCEGLKFLIRISLGLTHSADHKFRPIFKAAKILFEVVTGRLKLQLISSFTVLITNVKEKRSFKK